MSLDFHWRLINFSYLQIEEWDGEFTVFQLDAGKTHFLNKMGLQIILNLNRSSATESEICKILAEQFQLTADADFSQQIIKTLHRFDGLGLIEKVRSESSI